MRDISDVVDVENWEIPISGGKGNCKGNLTDLRTELHLSLAKRNPK
jgi:hypothetical protein